MANNKQVVKAKVSFFPKNDFYSSHSAATNKKKKPAKDEDLLEIPTSHQIKLTSLLSNREQRSSLSWSKYIKFK